MTQSSRLHTISAPISEPEHSKPEDSRDAAIRALGVLGPYITPEMRDEVLAKIAADCGVTAGKVTSVTGADVIENPSRVITDWNEVDEIMGGPDGNFFGPAFLQNQRGVIIPPTLIPKICITEAEVVSAKRLGHMLSLHPNTLGNGMSSTMLHIGEDEVHRHGTKVLMETPLGHLETFTNTADNLEWRQTSVEIVPRTSGLNYFQQIGVLVSYFKNEVVKGRTLSAYEQAAIVAFEQRRTELELLLTDWNWGKQHKTVTSHDGKPVLNWLVAANIMANLEITKLVRPTTVGLLNDIVNAKLAKIPMLTHNFTATADRYSFGSFVALGPVSDRGACMDCWNPIAKNGNYGAIFSYNRSARPADELSS